MWKKKEPTPITDGVIEAAREGVRIFLEEATSWGADIRYILAHRQYSGTRRSDPGELLWKAVALDYAVAVLGLKTLPNLRDGSGRTIPREWQSLGGIGRY
jgi:hypothetical protein